jgi:hypothetical protein
MLDEKADLRIV